MEPLLIDLGNDLFDIKLTSREEFIKALCEGPRMVGDNYLHVQRWIHNSNVESARIYSFLVWVCFPTLPVKYCSETWLRKAENHIRRAIKVDSTTLAASRGKIARVCVEVDLRMPLLAYYQMRGKTTSTISVSSVENMDIMKFAILQVFQGGNDNPMKSLHFTIKNMSYFNLF